ncbi:MAG: hypothetical protein LQ351_001861 [Letrouitia transgressa]|nr:MAG: hypothetical protein LQ351_001861 [Letrouitia transgressa]
MAYNAAHQKDPDTWSDDSGSPSQSSSSPRQFHPDMAHHRLPQDANLISPPMTRVSSSASIPLRHPTPDLQSLQGAYVGNVERLEQSAERLSLGSDIGEELRKLRLEQKRSESQGSSLMNLAVEEESSPHPSRQFSYGYGSHTSNSIVGMNTIARSGGFSPGAYFASPRSSIRSGSWSRRNSIKGRSASNGSRFAQMLEGEAEPDPSDVVSSFAPILPPPLPPTQILPPTTENSMVTNNANQAHLDNATVPEPVETPHNDLPRPGSADTYQQAQAAGLFADFDGVHASDRPPDDASVAEVVRRKDPSSRNPSGDRPRSYMEPIPGENMVYYPAPVPMILNLPQKLSKQPSAPQRAKRRSELLTGLTSDARKSAAWLPNVVEAEADREDPATEEVLPDTRDKRRTVSELPPQLRASLFFDYPAVQKDVEIKEGSAVKTLDSILDASAFAPVSAFTDHPVVGRVGKEVYGRSAADQRMSFLPTEIPVSHKRRNSINLLKKRNSSSNILDETQSRSTSFLGLNFRRRKASGPLQGTQDEENGAIVGPLPSEVTPLQNGDDGGDGLEDEEDFFDAQEEIDGANADNESDLIEDYGGQPTTLLAELQFRKQRLKQRNRTAATAFPNGMHSTLLELDTVAQLEKKSRQNKHTKLAWEDPSSQNQAPPDDDDEDVPLGMLFPGRRANLRGRFDEDRPLGLIAKREMEDNEPLSRRRARLRGEPSIRRTPSPEQKETIHSIPDDEDREVEGETLAQRLKRLKAQKQLKEFANAPTRTISGEFASEMMSQLGVVEPSELHKNENTANGTTSDLEDETLAQRRARLQAEKSRNVSGNSNGDVKTPVRKRRSMADLLHAHPAAGAGSRQFSNEQSPLPSSAAPKTPWAMKVQQRALSGNLPLVNGNGTQPYGIQQIDGVVNQFGVNGHSVQGLVGVNVPNPLMAGVNGKRLGMNGTSKLQPVETEARNRDMIDRWRQSVMY